MPKTSAGGLVYATDSGRMCPTCRQPLAACACACAARQAASRPRGDGVVRVGRESKGRGGKTVTVVRDAALNASELATLGKSLKNACGSGGTVKDGVIEVQGDHCQRVIDYLTKAGFTVKRVGG